MLFQGGPTLVSASTEEADLRQVTRRTTGSFWLNQLLRACRLKDAGYQSPALRGQVSAKLWPLDALNRRYQQLGRSGAGDGLGLRLRAAVREVNQRWEALQHFVTQWEEFETEREALRLWLTELSLRLMDVEHFSGGTLLEKMTRLQAFQEDVQANAERMDRLLAQGERLIQKSQPEDAELLEEELQDLSGFCQEIFFRVFCFWQQLVSLSLVFEDAWLSDGERDPESSCFTEESLALDGQREAGAPWPPLAPLGRPTPEEDPPLCHAHQVPKFGGALELEWDPSVDVGGSTSSRDEEDSSSSSSCSAIPGVDPWEEPRPACQSSLWGSRPLMKRHGSQEGLWALGGFRGPWEQLAGSARDPKRRAAGTSAGLPSVVRKACPWGAPRSPVKEGSCCPVEPMGFEPQRPETWLGKSWQEAAGRQLAREESDGRRQRCRLPAGETYHPAQSQRSSQPAKRGKPEQLAKRRAKRPFFAHLGLGSNGQISVKKWPNSQPAEPATTTEKGCSQNLLRRSTLRGTLRMRMLLLAASLMLLLLVLLLLWTASCPSLAQSMPSCFQAKGYARSFYLVLKHSGPPPT
nr:nesprin-4 [Pogona vitticeps]